MKKAFILATLVTAVVMVSCHDKAVTSSSGTTNTTTDTKTITTTTTTTGSTTTASQTQTSVKSASVDPQADMSVTGAAYNVDSISLSGDVLSVFVNYSGGCKDHSFELISNGMYAKSMPPQVSVILKHTNNGDNCRKLVMEELKFNVAALRYNGGKTTVIKMGDKKVTYAAAK